MKKPKYPPKVLHLFLRHKWYDMIASGEKKEEYRDIKIWGRRVCTFGRTELCEGKCRECQYLINGDIYHTTVNKVCLHRGYTSTTLTYEVPLITIKEGNTDWGAPKGKEVISLWLYKKVE